MRYLIAVFCILLICRVGFSEDLNIHEVFHRASLYGIRIPKNELHIRLSQLGLIPLTVISGMHFSIIMSLFYWLKIPYYRSILSVLLLFFWGPQIPVLRAFFHFNIRSINSHFKLSWPPLFSLALSSFLCILFLRNIYDFHSLWLSFVFCYIIENCFKKAKRRKLYISILFFLISPILIPFPIELSLQSIAWNLLFSAPLCFWILLSPLLHITPWGKTLCQNSYIWMNSQMQDSLDAFNISHPLKQGGGNYFFIFSLFLLFFQVIRICKKQKTFT